MTGYGRSVKESNGKRFIAEIRSLNSRYFDLNLRMPPAFREKEIELRNHLSSTLNRGKIDLTLSIESGTESLAKRINKDLVESYFKELEPLADLHGGKEQLLSIIMRLPDVVMNKEEEVDEEEWNLFLATLNEAINSFNLFREREGDELEKDLNLRVANIFKGLEQIEKLDPDRINRNKSRLHEQLDLLAGNIQIDQNRFEEEIIYYLEKMDITEEKVRLRTHCKYFEEVLQDSDPVKGKKIGFISQEIGREINTIGSKSGDATMQKIVVVMKDELEKIKEQMLNVL